MQAVRNLLNTIDLSKQSLSEQNHSELSERSLLKDQQEVVAKFPRAKQAATQDLSVRGVSHILASNAPSSDYNTTTFGRTVFHRVEPLQKEIVSQNQQLQSRLEMLCDALRSRY